MENKKSLTVKELIEKLQNDYKDQMDCEVFVNTGEEPSFYGLTGAFVLAEASTEKQFVALLAMGDVIKL